MGDKHTVHLREGGKAIFHGNGEVELHLEGPLLFHRQDWIKYLMPDEEARRAVSNSNLTSALTKHLAEAFRAVPMVVHPEDD